MGGSGNWIVDNLNSALDTWNDKLAEIWQLLTTSPTDFKGGGVAHQFLFILIFMQWFSLAMHQN